MITTILKTATQEQISEAQDWASDCLHVPSGSSVPPETGVAYVVRHYPGGWDAFVAECCTHVHVKR